jgi:hypothetical protein
MYASRHAQPRYNGRHAGVPQPGNPGWTSKPSAAYQILLPIMAGLLGLAVALLVVYRVAFG